MQIMKLLPTVCAVGICASFISVRADDTPMQAALRAALDQKMGELDKQQTQAPPVVVTSPGAVKAKPSKPTTKTVPAKATIPAATATTTGPTPTLVAPIVPKPQSPPVATVPTEIKPATPPPAETKPAPTMTIPAEPAAAATTTSETNAAPAASGTTPAAPVATMPTEEVAPAAPPPTETKPAAPTAEMKPAPAVETVQPAPVAIKPATPAITPAAGTVLQSPVMPATIKVKPGVMSATNQINAIYTGKELGLKPIESPLLPVTSTQQAQLQALLAKYKANKISPEEYHNQRAEILAQP
jgi:hypothetical protein